MLRCEEVVNPSLESFEESGRKTDVKDGMGRLSKGKTGASS